jgi:quercetin dioxygenase-like cupin family protein
MTPSPVLMPAGSGRVVHASGDEFTFVLEGSHTGGHCTVFIEVTHPGGGPPPHYHTNADEWFYVLEGRAAFFKDGSWAEVPPGSSVFIPRGAVHTFKNVGDQPLKQLITVSPSGFEFFMTRCAEIFAQPGEPDMPKIVALSAEHGIHYVTD